MTNSHFIERTIYKFSFILLSFVLFSCENSNRIIMMLDTGGLGDNITMELCKNGTVLFPSFEYSNVTVSTSTGNLNFRIKMYNNEKIKGIVNWNTGIILLPDVEREYMILDYKKDKIVLEDMDGEELIFYRPIGRVLSDDSY